MKHIEQAIHDLLNKGRAVCCLAEDVHEAFFLSREDAVNLVQAILFERAMS